MDVKTRLDERLERQGQMVARINAVADERQRLIEEALRLEGEIRLLKTMEAEDRAK
jgi:hypothetical protein